VLLQQERQCRAEGTRSTFLIGDLPGSSGTPAGGTSTRPPLTPEEIQTNRQATKPRSSRSSMRGASASIKSRWLSVLRPPTGAKLAGAYTVARMLERDGLSKRYRSGPAISIMKFVSDSRRGLRPVACGRMWSGAAPIEVQFSSGHFGRRPTEEPQVVITTPLLEGTEWRQEDVPSSRQLIGIT